MRGLGYSESDDASAFHILTKTERDNMHINIEPIDLLTKENKAVMSKLVNDQVTSLIKSKEYKKLVADQITEYFTERMWDIFDDGDVDEVLRKFAIKEIKARLK